MQSLILFLQENEKDIYYLFSNVLNPSVGLEISELKKKELLKFHFEFRFYFYELFPHHQLIDRNNISFLFFCSKLFA